jgi:hypothetical protein
MDEKNWKQKEELDGEKLKNTVSFISGNRSCFPYY